MPLSPLTRAAGPLLLLLAAGHASPEEQRPCEHGECQDESKTLGGDVAPVQLLQQDLHLSKGAMTRRVEIDALANLQNPEEVELLSTAGNQSRVAQILDEVLETTTTTTPPPTGLTMNAVGDLKTFLTSLVMYYGATLVCIAGFAVMRVRYPIVYSNNAKEGIVPEMPNPNSYIAWLPETLKITVDDLASRISLDHAMLMEYSHIGMKIFLSIGIPMIAVEGALNWICGGHAAGQDRLSYLSFGNVENKSKLYWMHCFVVWCVVIWVTHVLHKSFREFLPRRFKWLREMSNTRANTVLIDGVPSDYRSVEKVTDLFNDLIPGCSLEKVEFVKDTTALEALIAEKDRASYGLQVAEAQLAKDPENTPMVRESTLGSRVEAVPHWRKILEEVDPKIKEERRRVLAESKSTGSVNLSNCFVTFQNRTNAELALSMSGMVTFDSAEWVILKAPEPTDLIWADLTQDETARAVRAIIGYLLVAVLYFLYMPIVLFVTNLGKMLDLSKVGLGSLQSVWDGVAPTLGLQFMVAFLPTFLILIFKAFFTLRAEALQQHKLQIWYFWFQFVFVLLATAVGQNFTKFAKTLVSDPTAIIGVLADTMPYATHYYMNFLVLQAMSHGMNVTRYIPWIKYKAALAIFEEKEAKLLAEPEDQDYYGMGSRSARWTTMLGVGLVFGTLSPPINILTFINFAVCRVVYGYLFYYAENKKPDTGGYFFVTSLEQIFPLLILYVILMSGVLYQRAATSGPCIIAAVSIIWILVSLHKFKNYTWEALPAMELHEAKDAKKRDVKGDYVQPELEEK